MSRINRVVDYVSSHLDARLSLEELAGVAAFSPYHFHRVFTSVMDETPGDFITRLRLEQAAFRLTWHPDATVTEIAIQCGFESASGFARAFRRRYGMSALAWRRKGAGKNSKTGQTEGKTGQDVTKRPDYLSPVIESIVEERRTRRPQLEVKTLPDFHVAYVRHWGYTKTIFRAWDRLLAWTEGRELLTEGSLLIGVAHDDDAVVPARKCRYDACVTVPESVAPTGELSVTDLAGGKYAVLRLNGPHRRLWDILMRAYRDTFRLWLPGSGFQPANKPMLELYPPRIIKQRFELELCLPVRPL